MMKLLGGMALLFLCVGADAQTAKASFDCAKASSNVEKLICSDAGVAALDLRMTELYKKRLAAGAKNDAGDQLGQQKPWLTSQRNKCADLICLRAVYRARIDELGGKELCAAPRTAGGKFTMRCMAADDPRHLTITLSGTVQNSQASPTGIKIEAPGMPAQTFAIEGYDIFAEGMKDTAVTLVDVNFDGQDDLQVLTGTSSHGDSNYAFWLYDPAAKKFVATDLGERWADSSDLSVDPTTKTITVNIPTMSGGHTDTWRWLGGKLTLKSSKKYKL